MSAGESTKVNEEKEPLSENVELKNNVGILSVTKTEREIIRQIEYYFSDANLLRDKFLQSQIALDEEGGWVPLSVLTTFKRLAALSTDPEVIVNALKKSDECLVEISEDGTKLRRHPDRPLLELNEERRKEIQSRTVYIKGFPLETDISELLDFFGAFEKVANVYMRKYLDKAEKTYKFKGSVFVTFEKKEQAQAFIDKEKMVFQDRELLRKWQETYFKEKAEEKNVKNEKKKQKNHIPEIELPNGAVIHFEGATERVSREKIREAIEKIDGNWTVAYIDFAMGSAAGHIRFQEENAAKSFLEKLESNKLKLVDDVELTLRIVADEEEKAFIDKAIEQMKNRRIHCNKNKNNRKRRYGGDESHGKKKKFVDNSD